MLFNNPVIYAGTQSRQSVRDVRGFAVSWWLVVFKQLGSAESFLNVDSSLSAYVLEGSHACVVSSCNM